MAKFSVIIPVYNVAPYLRECLDSVQAQTFRDWVCVCVDDGSTDGSGVILDEYTVKDARFRVIHQANAGEGVARNAGLAAATGEWIVFLDGDDVLSPNALDYLAKAITPEVDCLRFGFESFPEFKHPVFPKNESVSQMDVDVSKRIDMSIFYAFVCQHTYRREAIVEMQFKRYKRGCDRVFFDDFLLNRTSSVRTLDITLYGYRQRATSAVHAEPSTQVLLDEMDHRLDIIRMIDDSPKTVVYAGDRWLEGYFTREFPRIAGRRKADRHALVAAWRERMRSLRLVKGLSCRGGFLVRLGSRRGLFPLIWLLGYWMPRIRLSIRYRIGIVRRCLCERRERR